MMLVLQYVCKSAFCKVKVSVTFCVVCVCRVCGYVCGQRLGVSSQCVSARLRTRAVCVGGVDLSASADQGCLCESV